MAGERILLMEDNESLRETVATILEAKGYEVISAVDGNDGLDKVIQGYAPDIIVSDVEMLGLNGPGAYQKIKKHYATKNGTAPPVLFITGLNVDDPSALESDPDLLNMLKNMYDVGAVGVLKKPLLKFEPIYAAIDYASKSRDFPPTPLKPREPSL